MMDLHRRTLPGIPGTKSSRHPIRHGGLSGRNAFSPWLRWPRFGIVFVLISVVLVAARISINTIVPISQLSRAFESLQPDTQTRNSVLVLGMHHSGTSVVARLLQEIGMYGGEPSDLLMLPGNKLKYNEYKPVVAINKAIIKAGQTGIGPWWLGYGFTQERVLKVNMKLSMVHANSAVQRLRTKSGTRPWFIKDPRLCVLADQYLKIMPNSVCVVVVRSPVEVALRMLGYNRARGGSLSAAEWGQVWEEYTVTAVRSCLDAGAPIILAPHTLMRDDPVELANILTTQLTSNGIDGLKVLSRSQVESILGSDYANNHAANRGAVEEALKAGSSNGGGADDFLSERAKRLWEVLDNGPIKDLASYVDLKPHAWDNKRSRSISTSDAESMKQPGKLSGASSAIDAERRIIERPINPSREAYVTMVSADDIGYLSGTMVLAASIRRFDSSRALVALVTEEVKDSRTERMLKFAGWDVRRVSKLPEPWFRKHPACRSFNEGQVIRWGRMFSKLQLWGLPFDKAVYLDTDTLVLKSLDDWFRLPNDFYAERSPSHKGINAGIMVVKPSKDTLASMLLHGESNEPRQMFKNHQVGCTEQELLNQYWHGGREDRKLNTTRHADYLGTRFLDPPGRLQMRTQGASVAHWITRKCPKPWLIPRSNIGKSKVLPPYCDPEMFKLWHAYYWSLRGVGSSSPLAAMAMELPEGLPAGLRVEGL